jgi:hypothetical protein
VRSSRNKSLELDIEVEVELEDEAVGDPTSVTSTVTTFSENVEILV